MLTEAGALLARDAGDLLTHAERVAAAVAEHRVAVAGTVTIAAFAIAARGLPPSVLRDLRSRHPDLSASLSELEPHEAIPALERGHVDVALVQDGTDDVLVVPPELCRTELMEDPLDVALPADHPLASRDSIAVAELRDEDWISRGTGQICHDWLIRTLGANGTRPRVKHTASEHSTQLALLGGRDSPARPRTHTTLGPHS